MIYLDSSVALAQILSEARCPPPEFYLSDLTSSRLLEFEVMNRVHTYEPSPRRLAAATDLLRLVALTEMTSRALARALRPFPVPVRTLDGLHLATMVYLRQQGLGPRLASYDIRLLEAAEALGFDTVQP